MKSIKDLREQYDLLTEKEELEQRKLTALVRAGLFDAHKLPMLKRALDKNTDKMLPAEKKLLIDLLDALMNQVLSSDQVYMKVKRNVQDLKEAENKLSKSVTVRSVPTIVVLKRRAIRVFPGGRQVGLYYAQQIDKYVTIPFGDEVDKENKNVVNVFEQLEQIDELDDRTSMNAFAKLHHKASHAMDRDEREKYVKKTAKVGVMHLSKHARKHGWENTGKEAKKILAYSKKYREVADLVEGNLNEVSSRPVLITPKPKPTNAAPVSSNTALAPKEKNQADPHSKNSLKKKVRALQNNKSKSKGRKSNSQLSGTVRDLLGAHTKKLSDKKYSSLTSTQKKFLTPGRVAKHYMATSSHPVRDAFITGVSTYILGKLNKKKQGKMKKSNSSRKPLGTVPTGPSNSIPSVSESFRANLRVARQEQLDEDFATKWKEANDAVHDAKNAFGRYTGAAHAAAGIKYLAKKATGKKTSWKDEMSQQDNIDSASEKRSPNAYKVGKYAGLAADATVGAIAIGPATIAAAAKKLATGAANMLGAPHSGGSSGSKMDFSKSIKDVEPSEKEKRSIKRIDPSERRNANKSAVEVQDYVRSKNYELKSMRESTTINLDGNLFEINTNMAEKLVSVYETLNENNKKKMIDMMLNEDTQNKVIEFVTRY